MLSCGMKSPLQYVPPPRRAASVTSFPQECIFPSKQTTSKPRPVPPISPFFRSSSALFSLLGLLEFFATPAFSETSSLFVKTRGVWVYPVEISIDETGRCPREGFGKRAYFRRIRVRVRKEWVGPACLVPFGGGLRARRKSRRGKREPAQPSIPKRDPRLVFPLCLLVCKPSTRNNPFVLSALAVKPRVKKHRPGEKLPARNGPVACG